MTLLTQLSLDPMLDEHERHFAPSVLSPFADDLARRLVRLNLGPLLEIAAGTGVLTQAVASALSAGLTIIATDPDAASVARSSAKPGMARVIWQQADPMALPFDDETFGLVVCQFGLAAMADRGRAVRQARRVMKPGGRFVFNVAGRINHNPVADCVQSALDECFPADPPRFLTHELHGYADNEAIDDDLTRAGFTDAVYTTVELPFAAARALDIVTGYCLGTRLRAELEARTGGEVEPVLQAATRAVESRFGGGSILSTMRALVISASG